MRFNIDILYEMCYKLGVTVNSDSRESMMSPYFHSARRHKEMYSSYRNTYSKLSPKDRRTVLEEAERQDLDVIYDRGGTIRVSGDYMDCDRMRRNLKYNHGILSVHL